MLPYNFPEALLNRSRQISLNKGATLFQQGDTVEALYYILKGELIALRYQHDGKPAVMMRHATGEMFAPASMNMSTYPCSARATASSTMLRIPLKMMHECLKSHPEFSSFYMSSLAENLKKQCARSERLRLKSAKERVLHFIRCESPNGTEITLTCPTSKWAEELGVEPESLYRTLKMMEKEGVIMRNKRVIKLNPSM